MAIENPQEGRIWVPSGPRLQIVGQALVPVLAGAVKQLIGAISTRVPITRGRAVKFETVSYGVNDPFNTGKLTATALEAQVEGFGGGAVVWNWGNDGPIGGLLGVLGPSQYRSDDHLLLYEDWGESIPGGIGTTGAEITVNAEVSNSDVVAHSAFVFVTALVEMFELARGK